jgi:hypothetical protein
VAGSLYKENTTDAEGKPLVYKSGAKIGQPRIDFFFALAIPKGAEKTWFETSWGQLILQVGATCFPPLYQTPTFAWKVEDGDSQIPNKKGKKPCDREGYPGNWILKTSGGYAPKTYILNAQGQPEQINTVDAIKPGYYVQAVITVDGNGSPNQPGVYLNHGTVCLRAVHHEIFFGPSVEEAGFGAAPLPAGVSTVPPAMAVPMPAGAPASPGLPAVPMLPSVPVVPSPSITAPVSPIPNVPVIPNPSFLTGAVPAVPMAVPVPPVPSRTMTAKANGASYEALIANGWTEALLIANGLMV